jgi:hypothetical protein
MSAQIKLALYEALIGPVTASACSAWEFAAASERVGSAHRQKLSNMRSEPQSANSFQSSVCIRLYRVLQEKRAIFCEVMAFFLY